MFIINILKDLEALGASNGTYCKSFSTKLRIMISFASWNKTVNIWKDGIVFDHTYRVNVSYFNKITHSFVLLTIESVSDLSTEYTFSWEQQKFADAQLEESNSNALDNGNNEFCLRLGYSLVI
ncbi:unnamed protein product [Chironomus riparius]|uniref:Uncharacterized protein n=1 Tax=Chironomus riparius TaxID=315576 RepID=A0A9N9WUZ9_9DIPT|nr:unnamed protein product [Chironomus riparius]